MLRPQCGQLARVPSQPSTYKASVVKIYELMCNQEINQRRRSLRIQAQLMGCRIRHERGAASENTTRANRPLLRCQRSSRQLRGPDAAVLELIEQLLPQVCGVRTRPLSANLRTFPSFEDVIAAMLRPLRYLCLVMLRVTLTPETMRRQTECACDAKQYLTVHELSAGYYSIGERGSSPKLLRFSRIQIRLVAVPQSFPLAPLIRLGKKGSLKCKRHHKLQVFPLQIVGSRSELMVSCVQPSQLSSEFQPLLYLGMSTAALVRMHNTPPAQDENL